MIDAVLYGALGFFIATLLALLFAPPLWNRAVRLTTKRIEASMPMSFTEIQAGKDQLRAEFAVELRRLESARDKAKSQAVRELVETSKGHVRIGQLGAELAAMKAQLEESEAAKLALERTLHKRLPELEAEARQSNVFADEIDRTNVELRHRLQTQTQNLNEARETLRKQRADIDRLRAALEAGQAPASGLFSRSDSTLAKQNRALIARLSVIEEELALANDRNTDDYLLREEMRKLANTILHGGKLQSPEFMGEEAPEPSRLASLAAARQSEVEPASAEMADEPVAAEPTLTPKRNRFGRRSTKSADQKTADKSQRSSRSLTERLAAHARRTRDREQPRGEPTEAIAAEAETESG